MDIIFDKYLLTIKPDKSFMTAFNGAVFYGDRNNTYLQFDTEEEMLTYIEEHGLIKE